MTELLGKEALLQRTRDERAALDDVYAKLTEDEICAPVLDGGWTMKDVLAHVTVWEQRIMRAIAAAERGEQDVWPEPGYTIGDIDRLNERDYNASKGRSLEDVRAKAETTFNNYLRWIEGFPPEQIAADRPYTPGLTLEQMIRGNGDQHYREHLDQVEAWWAGQGA